MGLDDELNALISESRSSAAVSEKMNRVMKKIKQEQKTKNYKLMRCMLFPEYSKGARFPNEFSLESGVYSIKSEYTVRVNSVTRAFGLAVNPHALGVTQHPMYFFKDATMEDWMSGVNINPYSSNENNPLFPPEVFFQRSRLIGCSVTVSCISQEVSGRLKGGIEYDYSDEFMSNPGTLYNTLLDMVKHAVFDTLSYFIASKYSNKLKKSDTEEISRTEYPEEDKGQSGSSERRPVSKSGYSRTTTSVLDGIQRTGDEDDAVKILHSYVERHADRLTEHNIHEKAMKIWRDWYRNSSIEDNSAFITNFHESLKSLSIDPDEYLLTMLNNSTPDFVEYKARLAMRLNVNTLSVLDSDSFRGGSLNYNRLQMLSYRNEVPFDEGIRVVYVPKDIMGISFDRTPKDLILIGGMQLPSDCALRINLIRHFEGIPYKGMNVIYPVLEQPEDTKTVKLISMIVRKNPDILRVPPRNVPMFYKSIKSRFKWVDITLREDGTGFEQVKDYSAPIDVEDLVPDLDIEDLD